MKNKIVKPEKRESLIDNGIGDMINNSINQAYNKGYEDLEVYHDEVCAAFNEMMIKDSETYKDYRKVVRDGIKTSQQMVAGSDSDFARGIRQTCTIIESHIDTYMRASGVIK